MTGWVCGGVLPAPVSSSRRTLVSQERHLLSTRRPPSASVVAVGVTQDLRDAGWYAIDTGAANGQRPAQSGAVHLAVTKDLRNAAPCAIPLPYHVRRQGQCMPPGRNCKRAEHCTAKSECGKLAGAKVKTNQFLPGVTQSYATAAVLCKAAAAQGQYGCQFLEIMMVSAEGRLFAERVGASRLGTFLAAVRSHMNDQGASLSG